MRKLAVGIRLKYPSVYRFANLKLGYLFFASGEENAVRNARGIRPRYSYKCHAALTVRCADGGNGVKYFHNFLPSTKGLRKLSPKVYVF
jgi:hypothetical protein